MPMKKSVFLIVLFLLFAPFIYASGEFELSSNPVQNKIRADETAKFDLTIQNNLPIAGKFRIFTAEYPTWDIYTDPIQNPLILEVGSKLNKTVTLIVDPLKVDKIGAYDVNVKVESKSSGIVMQTPLRVSILSSKAEQYIPTVTADIEIGNDIDPRDKIPIKINLNNQNILNISNLVIRLESSLIKDEINNELGPKERKTIEVTKQISPFTSPQEDTLEVMLLIGEEIITGPVTKTFSIAEYAAQSKELTTKKFLKTERELEFYSNNENYAGDMKVETSLFRSLFTSTNPKAAVVKENGKNYLVWAVYLEDNVMKVTITENYRALVYIAAIIIIFLIVYFRFRSPLTIQKSVANIEKKEGGISNLNVILAIKNRGKAQLKNIEVMDQIPNLADIEKEISIGTLQPVKVLRHEKKGSIVKWALENIDINEERVIRYKIRSKLSILGGFNLPAAAAKFIYKDKEMRSRSNRVTITSPSQS